MRGLRAPPGLTSPLRGRSVSVGRRAVFPFVFGKEEKGASYKLRRRRGRGKRDPRGREEPKERGNRTIFSPLLSSSRCPVTGEEARNATSVSPPLSPRRRAVANDGEKEYRRADLANILTQHLLSHCSPYLHPVYLVVGSTEQTLRDTASPWRAAARWLGSGHPVRWKENPRIKAA